MGCIDSGWFGADGPAWRAAAAPPVKPAAFPDEEKRTLLAQPGIGGVVIRRLEQCGIHSIASLRERGVAQIAADVAQRQGNLAWRNRVRALERALQSQLADPTRPSG